MSDKPGVLELPSGRRVEVERREGQETLVVRSPEGVCIVEVRLTETGAELTLRADKLAIEAQSQLTLRSDALRLEARRASLEVGEDLIERIGGDVTRRAGGAAVTEAKSVSLAAQPGGIQLTANDDVDVRGERIRLNSEDPPMPLTWEEHARRRAPR